MTETSTLPAELVPDVQVVTRWGKGSLGSETVAVECPDPSALAQAVEVFSERFGKAFLDAAKGIALLMAPTRAHDRTSGEMQHLVLSLAMCKSIPVEFFGGGRWESASGDRRTEPDESFYVGEVALEYRRVRRRRDPVAIDAFEEAHPATLVVEVEHTHYAAEKRWLFRELGMVELWEVGTANARRPAAIVDLQATGGARERGVSVLIPGVRAENLLAALTVLEELGGITGVSQGLALRDGRPERLIQAAGMGMEAAADARMGRPLHPLARTPDARAGN